MKNCQRHFFLLILIIAGWHNSLAAHPLAPGLLALVEIDDNQFQAIWKLPNKTADRGSLLPFFPDACELEDLQAPVAVGTGRSQSFKLHCTEPLFERIVGIKGMGPGSSGVLLRIQFLDGQIVHQMLGSQTSQLIIPSKQSVGTIFAQYIWLGIEHLLQGIDHVLFVITLAILVGWRKQLFWTITLFTLGHSVTLTLTALGFIQFPVFFIEAMIALSIAWAAADVIRDNVSDGNNTSGLLKKRPWLMSGGFGLLHGMGFAGALSAIGLPQQALTLSLAAFNIGIEIGQLLVIAIFFALVYAVYKIGLTIPPRLKTAACYAIGVVGAIWFWQRLFGL